MSITCPRCGRTSHNPNDAAEGYCGACHDWTAAWVQDSTRRQGLPERVEDPATIARIAAMMRAPGRR